MNAIIDKELKNLESQEKRIIESGKKIHTKTTFPLDILTNAVLDRALHLIFGFTKLIRDENYIAASHLVRCHLDNVLRYSAAWLVDDPHDFVRQIMKGTQVDKMKDRDGKKLRDSYLKDKLSLDFPWIKDVYNTTSGFVHLSHKHIFTSSTLLDEEKGIIEFRISKKDNYVPDQSRIEAIRCMNDITNVLLSFVDAWIYKKNKKE